MREFLIGIVTPAAIGWALGCSMVLAQSSQPGGDGSKSQGRQDAVRKPAPPPDRSQLREHRMLKEMPTLEGVPPYPAKTRFLLGQILPQGGPTVMVVFGVLEEHDKVLNWYKAALQSRGWNIKRAANGRLQASSGTGSELSMSMQSVQANDYRTRVTIDLREGAFTRTQ